MKDLLFELVLSISLCTVHGSFVPFRNRVQSPLANPEPNDHVNFGGKSAVSFDGTFLAVGASNFGYRIESLFDINGTATELPGAGAIFVYHKDDDVWDLDKAIFGNESENLGQDFDFSPNGEWLVVRRGDFSVEVYSTQSLILEKTIEDCIGDHLIVLDRWMALGCDRFNGNQGKILIFELREREWLLRTQMYGEADGDRFGFSMALDVESPQFDLLLAVSSPNAFGNRGMVRVFQVPSNAADPVTIVGQDLIGIGGEQFGFSLGFSNSVLVVGAPSAMEASGAVYIRELDENNEWNVFNGFYGSSADRLGRSVSISNDGRRVVASSLHHNKFSGFVQIYERKEDEYDMLQTIFGTDQLSWFGNSVSVSGSGSIISSGTVRYKGKQNLSSVGSVQVFIDESPFCGKSSLPGHNPFIPRDACTDSIGEVIESPEDCRLALAAVGTTISFCQWYESVSSSQVPTGFPSSMPVEAIEVEDTSSETIKETPAESDDESDDESLITNPNFDDEADQTQSVYGCPCDKDEFCTNDPFVLGEAAYFCIFSTQKTLGTVVSLSLQQGGSINDVLIADNSILKNETVAWCNGKSCYARTPLPYSLTFGDTAVLSGLVSVRNGSLRGLNETFLSFSIPFAVTEVINSEEAVEEVPNGVWIAAFLGMLVILLMSMAMCARAVRRRRNLAEAFGYDDEQK